MVRHGDRVPPFYLLSTPASASDQLLCAQQWMAIGMPQLITGSLEEYEQAALALASAPHRLAALRQELERKRDGSSLFDLPRYAGNIEAAYARMWQTWLDGRKPAAFSIDSARE
jgi:protein O-GlcNAc transferase